MKIGIIQKHFDKIIDFFSNGGLEHFTASLVGHHSTRSANKLTYGLYSAGISDAQKREIVEAIRLPQT
jgi:hypothetical protein